MDITRRSIVFSFFSSRAKNIKILTKYAAHISRTKKEQTKTIQSAWQAQNPPSRNQNKNISQQIKRVVMTAKKAIKLRYKNRLINTLAPHLWQLTQVNIKLVSFDQNLGMNEYFNLARWIIHK